MAEAGASVATVDIDPASPIDGGAHRKAGGKSKSSGHEQDGRLACRRGAIKALGPLEIMVNNAGILDGYFNVDETDEAVWRRVIDIDLTGVFFGCKRALAEMLPRGRGRIVNMASVAGLNGTGGGAAYVASKHGVVGLTRQMAVTYSARGITINAVCPGPILTPAPTPSRSWAPTPDTRGVAVNASNPRHRAAGGAGAAGRSSRCDTSPPTRGIPRGPQPRRGRWMDGK